MKKLVNHGGVIQYKWIVKTKEELHEYLFTVAKSIISQRIINFIKNPESDKQIEQIYHIKKVPPIQLAGVILAELWNSCEKYVLKGETLVFNSATGYCSWNDDMKILD